MNILAIETSFDETAASVVQDGTKVISNVLATSHEMHDKYGGVVPEIAARRQLECIIPVITETLTVFDEEVSESMSQRIKKNIDAIAVTVGPGLIGSLLVGVETAKTLAYVTGKPIIPVNHVLAHMYANFVNNQQNDKSNKATTEQSNISKIKYPAISLVVSGGHTELYLMKSAKDLTWLGGTLDDAAGECFDKTARLLGMGHGGGVAIQEAANQYPIHNIQYPIKLPRPMIHDETLNFSFSGLKTAVMREVNKAKTTQQIDNTTMQQFAYEIQEAITDVLVEKTLRAAKKYEAKSILLSGGVAANTRLREKFEEAISHQLSAVSFFAPPSALCTDNAVMIGAAAFFSGNTTNWNTITGVPDLSVEKI